MPGVLWMARIRAGDGARERKNPKAEKEGRIVEIRK